MKKRKRKRNLIYITPQTKPKKALKCKLCKNIVYVGEDYYIIEKTPFCKNCVTKNIAEDFNLKSYLAELYGNN